MVDLMAIQPNVISRDLRGKYILLAGKPKIGKTEFCALCPDSLILGFESGTNALPNAMVQPVEKWTTMKQVLTELKKPEVQEKYKTICFDTVGTAWEICEKYICAQAGVQKLGDIPYGGGYTATTKEFESTLRQISMLGYGMIFTSHIKDTVDDNGNVLSVKPDLSNRCLKVVNALVDVIGIITQTWDEQGQSQRWIQVRATQNVEAGTRFKHMQPKFKFGYTAFVDALVDAIEAEEKLGATVVDKTEREAAEVLDYQVVQAEAEKLWKELIEADVNNADKILKKVEIHFGRPMKLSEITEDQVDIYNLIVLDMREMAKAL